jgi:hypothetical protein
MKRWLLPIFLVVLLAWLITLQAGQMTGRPLLVKLGPAPNARVVELISGRFKPQLANWWVMKVLFYYGSLVDVEKNQLQATPEYRNMYQTLEAAVILDPYNIDAYYFAQAAFTWGVHRVKEVNALLEHGMKYRSWDYWLPFYAGFNASYFLHDYAEGARLMKIAAKRSGSSLPTQLAARYFYQAGETKLGIVFLQTVIKQVKDEKLRGVYESRLLALQAVQVISDAVKDYRQRLGHSPQDIEALVKSGILAKVPTDPYGGRFYLSEDGLVQSTSRFAQANKGKDVN